MIDQPEARCAGCAQPIRWRFTPAGKRMPLDATPAPAIVPGTYIIESTARCRPVDPLFDQGRTVYLNHWATCPQADQFKVAKGGKRS